jgi:hypothetical protein
MTAAAATASRIFPGVVRSRFIIMDGKGDFDTQGQAKRKNISKKFFWREL